MVARGLSATDLDGIRTTLASGRKPKVVFTESAGQIAGQAGQVVELRDPADDEWVVVRFGRDELPFSPTDLLIPARQPARRAKRNESPGTDRSSPRSHDPRPPGGGRDEGPAAPASTANGVPAGPA